MVIKFEECLKACHRVIIQRGVERKCELVLAYLLAIVCCRVRIFCVIIRRYQDIIQDVLRQSSFLDCTEHTQQPNFLKSGVSVNACCCGCKLGQVEKKILVGCAELL